MKELLTNSYTKAFRVFDNQALSVLKNEVMNYLVENSKEYEDDTFIHIPNLGKTFPNILDIIASDTIYNFISQLFEEPVLVQNNLFIKPPKNGIGIEWHIDFPYWQKRNEKIQFITCWINVSNAENDGNIEYIKGSHLIYDNYLDKLLKGERLKDILGEQFFNDNPNYVSVNIKEGMGQFHHPLIIHRSKQNNSDNYAITLGIVFSDKKVIENILNMRQGFPFKIEEGTTINDFVDIRNYRQHGVWQ